MDRLLIIDTEAARLAAALAGVDPAAPCPTCPQWSAPDLLWHLTEVHFFWSEILSRRLLTDEALPTVEAAKPARPDSITKMLALRERATSALLTQLAARDDPEPCWSWWPPDQTVGFTRRMQTYEATMHRVDAELTAGAPVSPIAEDVAAGAVDHAVDVMWGWMPDDATYSAHSVVEFVATDSGQTWLVEVGAWSTTKAAAPRAVRATSGTPAATVRAPVVDLALSAWTRGGSVTSSGDPAALSALNAVLTAGIQ